MIEFRKGFECLLVAVCRPSTLPQGRRLNNKFMAKQPLTMGGEERPGVAARR